MKNKAENELTHPDLYPRPAYVHMNSWAGRTRHRVIIRGKRVDGKYTCHWDDEPAFGRQRGRLCCPPPVAVEELSSPSVEVVN